MSPKQSIFLQGDTFCCVYILLLSERNSPVIQREMYAVWIKAEKYVKIEQMLLSPTHRAHREHSLSSSGGTHKTLFW